MGSVRVLPTQSKFTGQRSDRADYQRVMRMVGAFQDRIERLEVELAELKGKRGPGRPRKGDAA